MNFLPSTCLFEISPQTHATFYQDFEVGLNYNENNTTTMAFIANRQWPLAVAPA